MITQDLLKDPAPSTLRRTKILATLGPATDREGMLEKIIDAGVNIVRLNFSHDSHQRHAERIQQVREIAKKKSKVIGILADLQGPKIRIASFEKEAIELKKGATFILDAKLPNLSGNQERVGIDYKNLIHDVSAGDILFLDDGRLKLSVQRVQDQAIYCRVEIGGILSSHKGINKMGGGLSAQSLTEKDEADLKFVIGLDVDYVAISFPREAKDMLEAKRLIVNFQGDAAVIAKIERSEAITHLDDIIKASDGVMVARGDLAVEIGDAQVPLVQKDIINHARSLDKPVIIATQMMESMIKATVPTRAEVSDVATAVLDNADAVMLSAETAVGDYPELVVRAMARVCVTSEGLPLSHLSGHRQECRFHRIDEAIAMATMYTANHLKIKAILSLTESGATPLWMSRLRTSIPIYGLSRFKKTLGRMALYRGVYPIFFDPTAYSREEVNREAIATMKSEALLKDSNLVILTKGDHMGVGGGSNALKIVVVGQVV